MFDFVRISKHLSDGYFDSNNIERYNRLRNGNSFLKVNYNKFKQVLTVEGSLPYFMQGHNFSFDLNGAKSAINKIEELLDVELHDAEVKIMEYGIVVCPSFSIDDFTDNHLTTKGYNRDVYEKGGMRYRKKDKSYTLKFYSLWANINETENKVSKENREILANGHLGRQYNPMRYEIHGSPLKILKYKKVLVSEMLTEEYERTCQEALLKKYKRIKKLERLKVDNIRRLDSLRIALTLLSESCYNYQDEILKMIDRSGAKEDAKKMRKAYFKEKFRTIPHEKCRYSIEQLILDKMKK